MELAIRTNPIFRPLLDPHRYKGAHGGRGSGKSHFFAGLMVEHAVMHPGFRGVCIREVQQSLRDSAKRLIEDLIQKYELGANFTVLQDEIRTPGSGVIIFVGMQDQTAESAKSLEGFDVAWCEEAHMLSKRSLTILRPTIRKPASELWFSWNRQRPSDPVNVMMTGSAPPTDSVCVQANWNQNKWFPAVLDQERRDDLERRPELYRHIWEGDYATITEGAYYAASLAKAAEEGRIGHVAADPLMVYRAFWDIGGTGAKADACAIWIAQFIGREIRMLDYYEARGQPLAAHVAWLRENGYSKAMCILPHDGATNDRVIDVSFESALRQAGFDVPPPVRNQGAGAARLRIEALRRIFPSIWFDAEKTAPGREALGAYHERRDDHRNIGLGPEHDWASHAADALGLMAVAYEKPERKQGFNRDIKYPRLGVA